MFCTRLVTLLVSMETESLGAFGRGLVEEVSALEALQHGLQVEVSPCLQPGALQRELLLQKLHPGHGNKTLKCAFHARCGVIN